MTAGVGHGVELRRDRSARLQATALAALLPLLVMRPSLVVIAGATTESLGLPSRSGLLAVYGMIALAIGGSLPLILQRATHRLWGAIWLVLCALVVSVLAASTPVGFRAEIVADVLTGLGWLAVAFAIRDFGKIRRILYGTAFVILAGTGIQLAQISSGATDTIGYSQYLAYMVLPAMLIFVDASFHKLPLINGALALLSLIVMFSTGARGPLVVSVLYVVARIVLHLRKSPRFVFWAVAVGTVVVWLITSLRVDALLQFQAVLDRFGLSTRLSRRLLEGTLLEDRARSSLVGQTWDIISQNPFLGVGMANERLLLAREMGATSQGEALGWYPHNIFLELWAQFGIIFGTLLIVILFAVSLRATLSSKDEDRRSVVLLFVGLGLFPLMFSASYLSWPPFFALVGVCMSHDFLAGGKSEVMALPMRLAGDDRRSTVA